MKLSVLAMSRTWGPTRMPSNSSTTTTGGAKRFGTTATVTAASAATMTMTKKDSVSTWITRVEPILRRGRVGSPVDRARRGISGAL